MTACLSHHNRQRGAQSPLFMDHLRDARRILILAKHIKKDAFFSLSESRLRQDGVEGIPPAAPGGTRLGVRLVRTLAPRTWSLYKRVCVCVCVCVRVRVRVCVLGSRSTTPTRV